MPLAARLTQRMTVPTKSTSTLAGGEVKSVYDYTTAPVTFPCRLITRRVSAMKQIYGHEIQADAEVFFLVRDALTPLWAEANQQDRQQVKIENIRKTFSSLWEVLAVEDVDGDGRAKRAALKRWVT